MQSVNLHLQGLNWRAFLLQSIYFLYRNGKGTGQMPRRKSISHKLGVSLLNFIFISLLTLAANLATATYCVRHLGWPKEKAYIAALLMVFLFTFFGFRYVVYHRTRMKLKKQVWRYLLASIFLWIIEYILFVILATRMDYDYQKVILVLTAVSCFVRYLVLRHYVFKYR